MQRLKFTYKNNIMTNKIRLTKIITEWWIKNNKDSINILVDKIINENINDAGAIEIDMIEFGRNFDIKNYTIDTTLPKNKI